jgi:hypothetical protein
MAQYVHIVAVDDLDEPNRVEIVPKKHVNMVKRPRFPNLGPANPRHSDVRIPSSADAFPHLSHDKAQNVHLLLLVSSVPPIDEDHEGYNTRKKTVLERTRLSIQVIWKSRRRKRDVIKYSDHEEIQRVVCDPKDEYRDVEGFNGNKRLIWIPTTVESKSDVKTDPGKQLTAWKAVGCTCSDMIFRGDKQALYGCK